MNRAEFYSNTLWTLINANIEQMKYSSQNLDCFIGLCKSSNVLVWHTRTNLISSCTSSRYDYDRILIFGRTIPLIVIPASISMSLHKSRGKCITVSSCCSVLRISDKLRFTLFMGRLKYSPWQWPLPISSWLVVTLTNRGVPPGKGLCFSCYALHFIFQPCPTLSWLFPVSYRLIDCLVMADGETSVISLWLTLWYHR